jgi:four helix bundle protein
VPEFRQFLLYARGSAQETATQLRVAAALDASHVRQIKSLEARVILISKMIGRLHANPPPDR